MKIVEVAPRDGLQNEDKVLNTRTKIRLIHQLIEAGAKRIEATSFVHPKLIPQMADAEKVMAGIKRRSDVSLAGLVVNQRGYDRAVEAGVDEINYIVVATETFNQCNQRATIRETLKTWERIAATAGQAAVFRTVTIAASFGCPFEGEVSVRQVVELARRIAAIGVDELCLADTIGAGDPAGVRRKLMAVGEVVDGVPLRCHFHNTRNMGLANAYAAVEVGASALDASAGGVGGCPFAPAATGNIATEDLAYMLERMDIDTGLDLQALLPTVRWVGTRLGKELPGMLTKAGLFPPESVQHPVP